MLGVIFNLNSCKLLLIGALKTLWKDVNFSFLFLRKVKVRSRTSHQASVNRFSLSDPFLKRHISGTFSCNVCRPDALLFLLTADVLSEEAILKWYSDAHLSKGRSVFLEQMKKFVEWLKNAEEGKKNTNRFSRYLTCSSRKCVITMKFSLLLESDLFPKRLF